MFRERTLRLDCLRNGAPTARVVHVMCRVGVVAVLLCIVPAACGGSQSPVELRMYDPAGQVRSEVTLADVVRSSARATLARGVAPSLDFRLTNRGILRCDSLTRALARRGARLGLNQAVALEINGRVYARPTVDYRLYPDGLDCSSGIEVALKLKTAQRLASEIRHG